MVDVKIFNQYDVSSFNGSKFDKHYVMEYIFPNNFFTTPPNLTQTKYLSNLDIIWINKTYPGKPLPPGINLDGTGNNPFGGASGTGENTDNDTGENWFEKNWIWLVGAIVLIIIVAAIVNGRKS